MAIAPDIIQTRQSPQTRHTITRAQPRTTRVLLHQMHQLSSVTTNVSSSALPCIFSAKISDTFFRFGAHSRRHTADPTRTVTNSRVATSRGGTQKEKLVRDIRPRTRSKTVKGQGCHL